MEFPEINRKLTGVVTPVFSLRSSQSCGIGEFSDLPLLGQWCKKSGLDIIQILPVNDTGYQESPYSALSAFALHPVFIRLSEIPESGNFSIHIKAIREKFEPNKRVQFSAVLTAKLELLNIIYKENIVNIKKNKKIKKWFADNSWVKDYALFSTIRNKNLLRSWKNWDDYVSPAKKELDTFWDKYEDENFFHVWIQYHLDNQLKKAAVKLEEMEVYLKGDIPILMNEDSCDVWSNRDFFNLELTAGAPPDMFSHDGQNWGFPIYNWKNLKKSNYSWWKKRLIQAAKFYHAYRIDHVLGFFRIWNIPYNMVSGSMGYMNPSAFISINDLKDIGFDQGRINWLSKAHIYGDELRDKLGQEAESIIDLCLERIGNEDLFLFNTNYLSEKMIYKAAISDTAKSVLVGFLKDITLIQVEKDSFSLSWNYRNSKGFTSLSDWEKEKIENISSHCRDTSEEIWKCNALNLLSFMKNATDMLVCAEDLGAIPDCVPSVLEELGILGLKVLRWAREWGANDEPYIPINNYPELSVSTPSVHDSTTLRQWWYEEKNKDALAKGLNIPVLPEEPDTNAIELFLKAFFQNNSAICILQIQDFFALDNSISDNDIHFERINIPGTVQDTNWTYRISTELEDLLKREDLSQKINHLVSERKMSKITF